MVVLLYHVRAPTCDARSGKDRRVQRRIESEHRKYGCGVEIDVGTEMFLVLHRLLELLANRDPILFSSPFTKVAPDLTHDRHTRVALLVNTMAEPHNLGLFRKFFLQPRFRAIRCLDLVEHAHRFLVSTAVQWTLQRAACAGYGGVNIRER